VDKETIKNYFLDILFPRFCLGCGIEGVYLCEDCKATLEVLEYRYCLCDENNLRISGQSNKGKCRNCNSKKLSGLYSSLSYKEKPLTKKLIHFFKYPPYYLKDLAKPLASLVIDHILLLGENPFKNSVLIPIPLDKKKLKQRGYNQSEELAKEISKATGVPFLTDVLIKIKSTSPQMELPEEKRRENLKDAFACRKTIRDKKVFLVDDVYTTGSTMEECAAKLLESGTKEVWGIVIARD